MSANSLYDDISGNLKLTVSVRSQVGSEINVGEKFTLRLTGRNTSPGHNGFRDPFIVFLNPRIFVGGTRFARPVDPVPPSGSIEYKMPTTALFPGRSSSVDVEFEAIDDFDWFDDIWGVEPVAECTIRADVDYERFFRVTNSITYATEIVET